METNKTSKQWMNELLAGTYVKADNAKKEGKLICWATGVAPQELMETMGIVTVYPENHGAALGAKKISGRLIEIAENKGYSIDTCSYARNNFGYLEVKEVDGTNIPMPDLVLCCSNTCTTVIKWYENLSKQLNIPMLFFDTPFNHKDEIFEHHITYMKGQILDIIKQLEKITGRTFDFEKFTEIMKISIETSKWWIKVLGLAKHKPCPFEGFDLFNFMGIMVTLRGTNEATELMKLWYSECVKKAEIGEGPWGEKAEEKYRVMWDGIACWPQLSLTYKMLKKYGINIVCSNYPMLWNLYYEAPTIKDMAKAYSGNIFVNRDMGDNLKDTLGYIENYHLDGVIFHSNRSCKLMDFKQYEIRRKIMEITGVPSTIFDGDQTDPRVFSEAQFESRIQALVEIMEKNKNGGNDK